MWSSGELAHRGAASQRGSKSVPAEADLAVCHTLFKLNAGDTTTIGCAREHLATTTAAPRASAANHLHTIAHPHG
jgi:hypothetical protein